MIKNRRQSLRLLLLFTIITFLFTAWPQYTIDSHPVYNDSVSSLPVFLLLATICSLTSIFISTRAMAIASGIFLGGGLANLISSHLTTATADYIQLPFTDVFFNFPDMAIVIGLILLVLTISLKICQQW